MPTSIVINDSPVQAGPSAGPTTRNTADNQARKRPRNQRDASGRGRAGEAPASTSEAVLDLTREPAAPPAPVASTSRSAVVVDLTVDDDDVVLVGQTAPKKKKTPAKPGLSFAAPAPASNPVPEAEDRFKCPICLEKFTNAVSTPCGHVYCQDCLSAALKLNKKCPKCRKNVALKSVHRLFLE